MVLTVLCSTTELDAITAIFELSKTVLVADTTEVTTVEFIISSDVDDDIVCCTVSHNIPVAYSGQIQEKSLIPSMHVAPLRHLGPGRQSL